MIIHPVHEIGAGPHPDNLHRDQDPSTERGTALELVPKRYRAMTQYEANQYEV